MKAKTILLQISLFFVSVCSMAQNIQQIQKQVNEINNMVLYKAYANYSTANIKYQYVLQPTQSISQNWNKHYYYYDSNKKLRKQVQHISDGWEGGFINYYDVNGNLIYATKYIYDIGHIFAANIYLANKLVILAEGETLNEEEKINNISRFKLVNQKLPHKIHGTNLLEASTVKEVENKLKINTTMPLYCAKVCFVKPKVGDIAIINSYNTKLHILPSSGSEDITLPINSSVQITDSIKGWYKVKYQLEHGWIRHNNVEWIEKPVDEENTPIPVFQQATIADSITFMLLYKKKEGKINSAEIHITNTNSNKTQIIPLATVPTYMSEDAIYIKDYNFDGIPDFEHHISDSIEKSKHYYLYNVKSKQYVSSPQLDSLQWFDVDKYPNKLTTHTSLSKYVGILHTYYYQELTLVKEKDDTLYYSPVSSLEKVHNPTIYNKLTDEDYQALKLKFPITLATANNYAALSYELLKINTPLSLKIQTDVCKVCPKNKQYKKQLKQIKKQKKNK